MSLSCRLMLTCPLLSPRSCRRLERLTLHSFSFFRGVGHSIQIYCSLSHSQTQVYADTAYFICLLTTLNRRNDLRTYHRNILSGPQSQSTAVGYASAMEATTAESEQLATLDPVVRMPHILLFPSHLSIYMIAWHY